MSRPRWTEDDVEHLRKLARSGLSFAQISREMGRNASSVRLQAQKWDIAVASDLRGLSKQRRLALTDDPGKGPNMIQRAVLQHLSLTEWKLAHRLPIPAGEMTLGRLIQKGWIETRGKDHNMVARLTEAGVKAMRSKI